MGPGELVLAEDKLSERWAYWALAMIPFLFVVYTLLVGLAGATNSEQDERVRSAIRTAQWMTVLSWAHTQLYTSFQCSVQEAQMLLLVSKLVTVLQISSPNVVLVS